MDQQKRRDPDDPLVLRRIPSGSGRFVYLFLHSLCEHGSGRGLSGRDDHKSEKYVSLPCYV